MAYTIKSLAVIIVMLVWGVAGPAATMYVSFSIIFIMMFLDPICDYYPKWKNKSRVKTGPMPNLGPYRT